MTVKKRLEKNNQLVYCDVMTLASLLVPRRKVY